MAKIGFVLSHEQFPAPQLLDFGAGAERAGFDMLRQDCPHAGRLKPQARRAKPASAS